MNTAAFAGVAAYLLSMAAIAPEPVSLAVGVTTIVDVQQHYTIIDKIGTSYTGGPVLNLSEWEVNLEVSLTFSWPSTLKGSWMSLR